MPAAKLASKAPKMPAWPKSMGACADKLYDLREQRLAAKRVMEALEEKEKALKEHIINNLPKSDTGAAGKHHRVQVITKEVPRVEDWEKFYGYVKRFGAFDLLQRRLNETAYADRVADKKKVPGIGAFKAVSVSLTKV